MDKREPKLVSEILEQEYKGLLSKLKSYEHKNNSSKEQAVRYN